jgi:hypothetical protein
VIAALKQRGLWQSNSDEWTEWSAWDRGAIRYPAAWGNVVCPYDYHDQDGTYFYTVFRFDPKGFRPGFFDNSGKWRWRKHPRQMLYRLREVLEAPIVFLCEGEKDCETMRSWGFVATTNAGGAKAKWLQPYSAALRGREVILLPHNDQAGWDRAKTVYLELDGVAACIRVFDLPREFNDISDWFAAGHSEVEFLSRLEGVDAF